MSDDIAFGVGEVLITEEKPLEIMLGETKYFQAKIDPSNTSRLMIEERDGPTLTSDGINEDVWGNEPLEIISGDTTYGKRLGVYWETEKPQPDGLILPVGIIRMIGRYWHPDSIYKVKIKAKQNNKIGYMEVIVIRPDLLGTNQFAKSRDKGIDIEGQPYSVDSICIQWGGLYGFPPQNIKAQYEKESHFDEDLQAYTPAYRYEAWSTEFWPGITNNYQHKHFWVTSNSMGDGKEVPNHQNTRYMSYVHTPHSVWYFIQQYSHIVQKPAPYGGPAILGSRLNNGRLEFKLYKRPRSIYNIIRWSMYFVLGRSPYLEDEVANELSRLSFIEFMRDTYSGGLNIRMAQSRVASSYGPCQIMYSTAVENVKYPEGIDNAPEYLNDLDIFFQYSMKHYIQLLEALVGKGNAKSNNWHTGHYQTMIDMYFQWNDTPGYNISILQKAEKNYKPENTGGK